MTPRDVPSIVRSGFCTGCGLCSAIAGPDKIVMKESLDGYLRPAIVGPVSDTENARIRTACPGISLDHDDASGMAAHPIWGPVQSVRAGYSNDPDLRRRASSGGVVSAIALHLIETRKVAFVAQIAASKTDPFSNELAFSRSRDDVMAAAGSRYAPSAPLAALEELLSKGERFALVGKPCDIAAVRRLARTDRRIEAQIPFLLSFMCAGIPSKRGTFAILDRMGVKPNDVVQFKFRGDGWPGKARATTASGASFEMDYATSWGTILNKHLQFRCKICPDGTGEFADVVCADAWYGADGYPDFEERDGRSLIVTRTPAGEALIQEMLSDRKITAEPLPIEDVAEMQPYQVARKQLVLSRLAGVLLRSGRIPRYRKLGLTRAALRASLRAHLKSAVGTFRRTRGELP